MKHKHGLRSWLDCAVVYDAQDSDGLQVTLFSLQFSQ